MTSSASEFERAWEVAVREVTRGDGDVPTIPDFAVRVLNIVDSIPRGKVMTYGDVAAQLGSRGARAVGHVMARYGSDVAWWRVIRANGSPPRDHAQPALAHYSREATPLSFTGEEYRINLDRARYHP